MKTSRQIAMNTLRGLTPPVLWSLAARLIRGRRRIETVAAAVAEPAWTPTQELFIRWNAGRLGIPEAESRVRYAESWRSIPGGHRGDAFRAMITTYAKAMAVFAADNPREVFAAYRLFAPLTLLRLASYPETEWPDNDPLVEALTGAGPVQILDFGCGLAQRSRALAARLKRKGVAVRLQLADIPTLKDDFLEFIARETDLDVVVSGCTEERPIPPLEPCHVCFAEEFFEHVHEPLAYVRAFDSALLPGGFLVTNVVDHRKEFMHVHPDLGDVREYLAGHGFRELRPDTLFQKRR